MSSTSQKLLILDLDETLVFSSTQPQPHLRPPDLSIFDYAVWRRPYLSEFLTTVQRWYRLAVWTVSTEAYAQALVPHLFAAPDDLLFVWARPRCTWSTPRGWGDCHWIKNLNKVKRCFKYPLEQIVMLDDSAEKLRRHYGNHMPVQPFEGQHDDTELRDSLPFLAYLHTLDTVRSIEKRTWRTQGAPQ